MTNIKKSFNFKDDPTNSPPPIDEADSRQSSSEFAASRPSTRKILLKRRSSRISNQIVGSSKSTEEVDSAVAPRPAKRRSQKKQKVALFLDSDYPRKK